MNDRALADEQFGVTLLTHPRELLMLVCSDKNTQLERFAAVVAHVHGLGLHQVSQEMIHI